ncbi:SARP family transcriptional regulator [Kribbella sandramycini]|uniref:DNA-binding SARP family transcriptional activator n=1 Tax=Kribbella sandramycini TaxID=60450 RepID=A0A7Y4L1F8_9ACTN|nr:DNA-binding SARP family transcriptional activator [Kribbella sandramycini]NOL42583.1 SARP family transcriptional regulator [Kribbella sandramycini]
MEFGVLGPVVAWDDAGQPVQLKGPRHRAVLARLIVAGGRVVPATRLVDDLWEDPPDGALSALRTFVAALRRALEPDRPRRTPARVLVTEGPGYALRTDSVDAVRFEQAIGAGEFESALSCWRGPAYADFADEPWARAERARLTELRLLAVERYAEQRLAAGRAAEVAAELDAHVIEHPWREEGWRLLALSLYRSGRQADALAVLRRAQDMLVSQLGIDPGAALLQLETDILNQATHLEPKSVWSAYERTVSPKARLESTVGLLRSIAVSGGLHEARQHRLAAITAAEQLGDSDLVARVIGAYDVPANWTRSDDEADAAAVVRAAERVLPTQDHPAVRARLLATIALESRGSRSDRSLEAAGEAERLARELDDPAVLAFALNGVYMQSFRQAGQAPARDAIGAELVDLASRHALPAYEVLGRLIRLQSACAVADYSAADMHAAAADELAARHDAPLVGVFTGWYAALRADTPEAYQQAAVRRPTAAMPGLHHGLLELALAAHALRHGAPIPTADYGPHIPWIQPLVIAQSNQTDAERLLQQLTDPPPGLLLEAHWALVAHAAAQLGFEPALARAQTVLRPAAQEQAGAQTGLLTLGPVASYL